MPRPQHEPARWGFSPRRRRTRPPGRGGTPAGRSRPAEPSGTQQERAAVAAGRHRRAGAAGSPPAGVAVAEEARPGAAVAGRRGGSEAVPAAAGSSNAGRCLRRCRRWLERGRSRLGHLLRGRGQCSAEGLLRRVDGGLGHCWTLLCGGCSDSQASPRGPGMAGNMPAIHPTGSLRGQPGRGPAERSVLGVRSRGRWLPPPAPAAPGRGRRRFAPSPGSAARRRARRRAIPVRRTRPAFQGVPRGILGHSSIPTAVGRTACQTSTYGCPSTATCGAHRRVTSSAIRVSFVPGTR